MDSNTLKALIIDDDQIICDVVEAFLFRMGYTVEVAHDGVVGLEMVRKGDFTVIFTDIVMPRMEGIGVLRELKRDQPDLKVVTMSGADNKKEYMETATNFGADAILIKPFSFKEFDDAMKKLGL